MKTFPSFNFRRKYPTFYGADRSMGTCWVECGLPLHKNLYGRQTSRQFYRETCTSKMGSKIYNTFFLLVSLFFEGYKIKCKVKHTWPTSGASVRHKIFVQIVPWRGQMRKEGGVSLRETRLFKLKAAINWIITRTARDPAKLTENRK